MAESEKKRLSKEQREEVTRRALAGEKASLLGKEYGVTRAYVSLLKMQALEPERFAEKAESKLTRKLSRGELAQFDEALATGTPESHGLIPAVERWSYEHGYQLAWKLFQKRPSVRAIKQCMEPHIKRWEDYENERPKPPKPHHVNQLDPELAKDEDFVAYYLSPVCERIAWKEYEFALADWERRQVAKQKKDAEEEAKREAAPAEDAQSPEKWQPVPGLRIGKHAKSKGSPFTPPKRRKRK
jgi:hypothetical protein